MGVRLGGWRRIMPFLFSLPPRRHELYGSAKYVAMPGSSRSSACRENSVPSSCVTPVRAAAGSRENMAFCAATLAAAVLSGTICGHGETGAPLDLGVQAAARADDAVGLPLAETAPVVLPVWAFAARRAQRDAAAARTPAAGLAPAPAAGARAPGPPLPPGLVGVCPPADGLRAAARHGAAGMLHGEAPAHQRRRPAPARPLRDPRPQAARRQAPRSTRNRLAAHGPAARGPGHVAAARPRTRPGPPGPVRPVRFALVGREPRVASDLPAGRGRMPSRHHGHAAHARPVAHLNPDDLPFLFRQVRIHLAQGATPLRLAIRTISNLTGAALSIRQRAKEQKTFICGGRLAYVFLGKKKSPAAMRGFSNEVIREEENDPV